MTYLLAALTFAFLTQPLWSQTDEPIALSAGTGDVVLPDIVSISSVAKSRPHQSGGSGVAPPIAKRVDDVHGGSMLNEKGEVIGIVSYIVSSSGDSAGLGFATTINIASDLMFNQPHWWSGLEIVPVTDGLTKALNVPQPFGLLVQRVADGSIGHQLRIRPGNLPVCIFDREFLLGGDIILSVAGIKLVGDGGQMMAIREASQLIPNCGRFEITVWREGEVVTLFTTKGWK